VLIDNILAITMGVTMDIGLPALRAVADYDDHK